MQLCYEIQACAGSGKTTYMLQKATSLAKQYKSKTSVLVLTFSKAASQEFQKRIAGCVSNSQIVTIHSLAQTINNFSKKQTANTGENFIEFCIHQATRYIRESETQQLREISKLKKVQDIFVDEAQDLSETQINFIKALTRSLNVNLYYVGDKHQCIYQFQGAKTHLMESLKDIFEEDHIQQSNLFINYRSQKNIIELTNKLRNSKQNIDQSLIDVLKGINSDAIDLFKPEIATNYDQIMVNSIECGKPDLPCIIPTLELVSQNKYIDKVIQYIQHYKKDDKYDHIAVIGSVKCGKQGNLGIQSIRNKLQQLNIPSNAHYLLDHEQSSKKQIIYNSGVNLLTIHSSKGLEFEVVLFIDFHHQLMNTVPTNEEYTEIFQNLLYVGFTRAQLQLHIFAVPKLISEAYLLIKDCIQINGDINSINIKFKYKEDNPQSIDVVTVVAEKMSQEPTKCDSFINDMVITTICTGEDVQQNQLGDFAFPIGITAEYIAGYALKGQQFITKLIDSHTSAVRLVLNYKFCDNIRIPLYFRQLYEFELFLKKWQKRRLYDNDINKVKLYLSKNCTVIICHQTYPDYKQYINKAIDNLRNCDIQTDSDKIPLLFYELALAQFVEKMDAKHLYQEDYLQVFKQEEQQLNRIFEFIKKLDNSENIQFQKPICNTQLQITGIIDIETENSIIELKYTNNLSLQNYFQVLIYGLIQDPENRKTRILFNIKTGEIKEINPASIDQFNKKLLTTILNCTGKKLVDSVIVIDFETTTDDMVPYPDPYQLDIIEAYFYDYNFKFPIIDCLINQTINRIPVQIGAKTTQITGITKGLIQKEGRPVQYFTDELLLLSKQYQKPTFVAHYPYNGFDNILLRRYLISANIRIHYKTCNTMRVFFDLQKSGVIPVLDNMKLQTIYNSVINCEYKQNHRAEGDVHMIVTLFQRLFNDINDQYFHIIGLSDNVNSITS